MLDENPDRPKVTPLFRNAPANEIDDHVRQEIQALLTEAEPLQPRDPRPSPEHRNAVMCPQCDEYTWRGTPECICCGFKLHAYFIEQEQEAAAKRRRAITQQMMFFAWSGLGGGLGLLTLSAHLPAVLSRPAKILGLVCLAAGFICFKAAG